MNRWVVVAVALAFTPACRKEKRDDPAIRESRPAVKPAPIDEPSPMTAAAPLECERYAAAIKRLASCRELPVAMRETLRETYQLVKSSAAHVTPDGRTTIASACLRAERQASDAAKGCTFEVEDPLPGLESLPESCQEYAAAIELLSRCDKLPKTTQAALRDSYQQTQEAWKSVPPEGRNALAAACASAAAAVKQSAAACN